MFGALQQRTSVERGKFRSSGFLEVSAYIALYAATTMAITDDDRGPGSPYKYAITSNKKTELEDPSGDGPTPT